MTNLALGLILDEIKNSLIVFNYVFFSLVYKMLNRDANVFSK